MDGSCGIISTQLLLLKWRTDNRPRWVHPHSERSLDLLNTELISSRQQSAPTLEQHGTWNALVHSGVVNPTLADAAAVLRTCTLPVEQQTTLINTAEAANARQPAATAAVTCSSQHRHNMRAAVILNDAVAGSLHCQHLSQSV
jgi:hypothetical protein